MELEVVVKFLPKPNEPPPIRQLGQKVNQEEAGQRVGQRACQFLFSSVTSRRGTVSSPAYSQPANTSCAFQFQAERVQLLSN